MGNSYIKIQKLHFEDNQKKKLWKKYYSIFHTCNDNKNKTKNIRNKSFLDKNWLNILSIYFLPYKLSLFIQQFPFLTSLDYLFGVVDLTK